MLWILLLLLESRKDIHLSMLKLKMTLGRGVERAQPFPTLLMSARQP